MATETAAPNWKALMRQAEDRLERRLTRRQESASNDSVAVLQMRLNQALEDLESLRTEYETLAESHQALAEQNQELAADMSTLVESYDQQLIGSAIDRRAWELNLNPEQAELLAKLVDYDPEALFSEEGDLLDDALDAVVFSALEKHGERLGVDMTAFNESTDDTDDTDGTPHDGNAGGANNASRVPVGAKTPATTAPPANGATPPRQSAGVGGRTPTNEPNLFVVTKEQARSALWKQENREALNSAIKAGTFKVAE